MKIEIKNRCFNILKFCVYLIPLGIFFWIINQNYALTGQVKYNFNPGGGTQNNIINLDQTDTLLAYYSEDGAIHWKIADDNFKFTVKLLRNFEKIKLRLLVKNISQDHIDLYAQGRVEKGEFRKIVSSQLLDQLTWPSIVDEQGLRLWQRPTESSVQENDESNYDSINDFFNNLPNLNEIGVMNFSEEIFYHIDNPIKQKDVKEIPHFFRGAHTIYTYMDGSSNMNFSLKKIDLNREEGSDSLNISLYLGTELVYHDSLSDDGNISANGLLSDSQNLQLDVSDLEEGLYRIEIRASEDVIFGDISTTQNYLAFNGKLFIAEGPEYFKETEFNDISFQTDSNSLSFQVPHDISTGQTVTAGRLRNTSYKKIDISEKKIIYEMDGLDGVNYLNVAKGDILILGDDFVFDDFEFLPDVELPFIDEQINENLDSINYILAAYTPKETHGKFTIEEEYDIEDLLLVGNDLYFNLRSPGLYNNKNDLEIVKIEATLTGKALTWQRIFDEIKRKIDNLRK